MHHIVGYQKYILHVCATVCIAFGSNGWCSMGVINNPYQQAVQQCLQGMAVGVQAEQDYRNIFASEPPITCVHNVNFYHPHLANLLPSLMTTWCGCIGGIAGYVIGQLVERGIEKEQKDASKEDDSRLTEIRHYWELLDNMVRARIEEIFKQHDNKLRQSDYASNSSLYFERGKHKLDLSFYREMLTYDELQCDKNMTVLGHEIGKNSQMTRQQCKEMLLLHIFRSYITEQKEKVQNIIQWLSYQDELKQERDRLKQEYEKKLRAKEEKRPIRVSLHPQKYGIKPIKAHVRKAPQRTTQSSQYTWCKPLFAVGGVTIGTAIGYFGAHYILSHYSQPVLQN